MNIKIYMDSTCSVWKLLYFVLFFLGVNLNIEVQIPVCPVIIEHTHLQHIKSGLIVLSFSQ